MPRGPSPRSAKIINETVTASRTKLPSVPHDSRNFIVGVCLELGIFGQPCVTFGPGPTECFRPMSIYYSSSARRIPRTARLLPSWTLGCFLAGSSGTPKVIRSGSNEVEAKNLPVCKKKPHLRIRETRFPPDTPTPSST